MLTQQFCFVPLFMFCLRLGNAIGIKCFMMNEKEILIVNVQLIVLLKILIRDVVKTKHILKLKVITSVYLVHILLNSYRGNCP